MPALLCAAVAVQAFPLGIEVDFGPILVPVQGAPALRYTIDIELMKGGKDSTPLELSRTLTHKQMRDMVSFYLRSSAGWATKDTSDSAFVLTPGKGPPVKSLKITGDTPADTPPIVRLVPRPR